MAAVTDRERVLCVILDAYCIDQAQMNDGSMIASKQNHLTSSTVLFFNFVNFFNTCEILTKNGWVGWCNAAAAEDDG